MHFQDLLLWHDLLAFALTAAIFRVDHFAHTRTFVAAGLYLLDHGAHLA